MKPGYKIIIALLIVYAIFSYRSHKNKERQRYVNQVKNIVTDIRHRDYFKFQDELTPKFAKSVSIDNIEKFMQPLNFERNNNIDIFNIEENDSRKIIDGTIDSKKVQIPFNISFSKDANKSLLIDKIKIGNSVLKADKSAF